MLASAKFPAERSTKYEILRVPTFVFFRGDKEIGRVTERAVTTLENDIAAIVAK